MTDIKMKPSSTIKKINKAKIGTQKLKENLVDIKEKTNETISEGNNINEYGTNRIYDTNNKIINRLENSTEKIGNRAVKESYNNAIKLKEKMNIHNKNKTNNEIKNIKNDLAIKTKKNIRTNANKIASKEIKTANSKNIKIAKNQIKNTQNAIKNSKKVAKETIKTSKKAAKVTKEVIKKSIKIVKAGAKVTIKIAKSVISSLKGLIFLIIAGGWISLIVILIITLCMSVIAIFNRNGDEDTAQMWNSNIVNVAETQIGVTGGAPYWSWYGFYERVEWCACFVSWCADQCGLIENESIPKFSSCKNGIEWFKEKERWADREGYIAKTGDIIFFDWQNKTNENQDGVSDHVGIVKSVDIENNKVHTIEGNSGDAVKERTYDMNDIEIMGYGIKK